MGLAEIGTPLSYEETVKWAPHVREHGILQFINLYNKQKNRKNDAFKWGDEIEYTLVKFNNESNTVKLNLRSHEILKELHNEDLKNRDGFWAPEYGAFMIEGTPAKPFEGMNFNLVEANMRKRREEVKQFLKYDEDLMCITSFPRMGCENFTDPHTKPTTNTGLYRSRFLADACIFPGHPRYINTTTNIMERRGEKPYYNLAVFKDKHTKYPLDDSYKTEKNALRGHIYLDSMGFGCGYCCLQVTFQASDLNEARILYDQLAPFGPIMMALTSAAPFHRGFISDVDTRWNILCNTQDCRNQEEKGFQPPRKNKFIIKKSRHDSIDCYISPEGQKFNDIDVLYHKNDYKKLIDNGIDSILAQHIAHLFIRDTISMFKEKIHQNDEEEIGHFDNIQSTVWQTVRLKPPPPKTDIGWRVEFRPCDVQITDFENAAVVSFLVLLTRVILTYKLNFLVPISKIDENIQRAQKRNASQEQRFWFRKDIFQENEDDGILKKYAENQDINEKLGIIATKKLIIDGKANTWNLNMPMVISRGTIYKTMEYENIDTRFIRKKENRRRSLQLKYETNTMRNDINKIKLFKKVNLQEENDLNKNIKNEKLKNAIFNENTRKKWTKNGLSEKENQDKRLNTVERTIEKGFENNGVMKNRSKRKASTTIADKNICMEMTIDEILNGKNEFPGIIPLIKKYVDTLELDVTTSCQLQRYLILIEGRASGKIFTPAAWMRKFAMEHPDYKNDSVVTEKINFDLLKMMQTIQDGKLPCPELLGQSYQTNVN